MKKIYVYFVLALLVMAMIPATIAQTNDNAPTPRAVRAHNVNARQAVEGQRPDAPPRATPARNIAQQGIANRLRVCHDFLKKNDLAEKPIEACKKILDKELDCVEFLTDKGVDEPVAKCDRLFAAGAKMIKARSHLSPAVTNALKENKLKNLDRFVDAHPEVEEFVQSLEPEMAELFAHLPRGIQIKIADSDTPLEDLSKYELHTVAQGQLFKARKIGAGVLANAKAAFNNAKEGYNQANNIYNEKKENFLKVKNQLEACKGQDTEECVNLRNKAMENAQAFVAKTGEMAIKHLEKIKSKAEGAENLDQEKVDEIIADVDAAIEELQAAIDEVNAATTKEEVQAAAKKIDEIWNRIRHKGKLAAARIVNAAVGEIIDRSEHLESKLDCTLAAMEEQGIDVNAIDLLVEDFSMKIQDANEKYDLAQEYFEQAEDLKTENPDETEIQEVMKLVNRGRELMRQAHTDLKDAHQVLRHILREIRANGGNIEACEEEGEEELVVEELDDDSEEEEEETEDDDTEDEDENDEEEEDEEDNDNDEDDGDNETSS